MTLKQMIERDAYDLSFSAFGVAAVDYDPLGHSRLAQWLEADYQASMEYMQRGPRQRFDPRTHLPDARSVIVCSLNYYVNPNNDASKPYISVYARGENYHFVLRDKLEALVVKIKEKIGNFKYRVFVDSQAFSEKTWAQKAGIGFLGRNAMLIIPPKKRNNPARARGSFHFLGVIISDLYLEPDSPGVGTCGECRKCIDACPTNAIIGDAIVDSNRCISYHTTQNNGEIPNEIASAMSNMIFGCDICQLVCPYNSRSDPTSEPRFEPVPVDFDRQKNITENEFKSCFAKSSLGEIKFGMFERNLRIAWSNLKNRLNRNWS